MALSRGLGIRKHQGASWHLVGNDEVIAMLHTANSRRPRVLVGQEGGLSKCTKCGVAFVAKHPAQQTCSKCTVSRGPRGDGHALADHKAKAPRNHSGI